MAFSDIVISAPDFEEHGPCLGEAVIGGVKIGVLKRWEARCRGGPEKS